MYYKAVTLNLRSLGLRRVKPIQYRLEKWVFPRESPQQGEFTPGGLWVGKNKSFVNWLRRYMKEKYQRRVLIYECKVGETLFETTTRIKTTKVKLIRLVR